MGSLVVVLGRENDHFILCIKLRSKANMKEANAERMSRHPPDSAAAPVSASERTACAAAVVKYNDSGSHKNVPCPAARCPLTLQTVCILLSRDVLADVVSASSTRPPAFLSERAPRPPRWMLRGVFSRL